MEHQLQAIATVISLVNPAICGAMFQSIEAGRPAGARFRDATRVTLVVLVILAVAAFFGVRLLGIFGVSLDAFTAAGGAVLSWMGFSMLKGNAAPAKSDPDPAKDGADLTPLILFAASPGTITGVITISAVHTKLDFPLTALVAVGVSAAAIWLVMLLLGRAGNRGGSGFVHEIVSRLMGLIVIAMGVQFLLTGVHAFMTKS